MAAVGARRLRRRFVTALAIVATFAPGLPAIGSVPAGGSQLWEYRFTTPGRYWDEANSVATSSDGSKVFVTGFSKGDASAWDYATVAYDASTGAVLWGARYNGPGNSDDVAKAVAADPDGSKVFVTGYSQGTTTSLDFAT